MLVLFQSYPLKLERRQNAGEKFYRRELGARKGFHVQDERYKGNMDAHTTTQTQPDSV